MSVDRSRRIAAFEARARRCGTRLDMTGLSIADLEFLEELRGSCPNRLVDETTARFRAIVASCPIAGSARIPTRKHESTVDAEQQSAISNM